MAFKPYIYKHPHKCYILEVLFKIERYLLKFEHAKMYSKKESEMTKLTEKQFDILEKLVFSEEPLSQRDLEKLTDYSLGTVNKTVRELTDMNYMEDGKITPAGIAALEPYSAKRAIFIAAGFGSRLAPITFNTPKPLVRVHGVRIIDRLIEACITAGIEEIYIVRGYLAEQFDQLLYKYPNVKFLENPVYNEANNISSSLVARHLLSNAYVFEADLLISNPDIIKKYHYTSDFLAIKTDRTDDWCFTVKDGIIIEEKVGGEGDNIWQMVGISYWSDEDGAKLAEDIPEIYSSPGGRERYWEQVPLVYKKNNYEVAVRECKAEDIVEIDTFNELKKIDKTYDV